MKNSLRLRRYAGHFRKGHDPRRHIFTREECRAGFWAAIESIITRHPEMTNARSHIALNFLPVMIAKRESGTMRQKAA